MESSLPPVGIRAATSAVFVMDALYRSSNLTGWLHDKLDLEKLRDHRNRCAGTNGYDGVRRAMWNGAVIARQACRPLTVLGDYVVGSGKVRGVEKAPLGTMWRQAFDVNAHDARAQYLKNRYELPGDVGLWGTVWALDCGVRGFFCASLGGALGGVLKGAYWGISHLWTRPAKNFRATVQDGVVSGATLGAALAGLSTAFPLLSGYWQLAQITRGFTAVLKGVITGVGCVLGLAWGLGQLAAQTWWPQRQGPGGTEAGAPDGAASVARRDRAAAHPVVPMTPDLESAPEATGDSTQPDTNPENHGDALVPLLNDAASERGVDAERAA